MNKTKIEWVKNPDGTPGYTWNPITGCLNHDNGLCKGGGFPCYAYKLANGRLKGVYQRNHNIAQSDIPAGDYPRFEPFYPRFWEERCLDLTTRRIRKHWRTPRGIFVCDMGELFGDWIPQIWQERVFNAIKAHPHDRFYLLTKQPQNLIKFSPFPDNCFVGVTATNDLIAIDAGNYLENIQAKIKFTSFEPLLQWDLGVPDTKKMLKGIDWLIIGAQTKPYKPPKIEWVREIVEAADRAGIRVFLKDNLKPLFTHTVTIEDKWVWAKDLGFGGLFRQEMP